MGVGPAAPFRVGRALAVVMPSVGVSIDRKRNGSSGVRVAAVSETPGGEHQVLRMIGGGTRARRVAQGGKGLVGGAERHDLLPSQNRGAA